MSEALIPQQGYDAEHLATAFEQMAARIRLNKGGNFGGAFVLVPPPGFGESVDSLILNSTNAKLQFWADIKQVVDETLVQLRDAQRLAQR